MVNLNIPGLKEMDAESRAQSIQQAIIAEVNRVAEQANQLEVNLNKNAKSDSDLVKSVSDLAKALNAFNSVKNESKNLIPKGLVANLLSNISKLWKR